MVVLLLVGIGLGIVQTHSFTELWILIALAGFAVAFVIGTIFLSRIGIELNRVVDSSNPDDAGARADRPLVHELRHAARYPRRRAVGHGV